jgi:hypothetical protein
MSAAISRAPSQAPVVHAREKYQWGGYTDASDEEGRNTPSTERRALFAVVLVYLLPSGAPDFPKMRAENGGQPCGYLIDHRHSACYECLQLIAHGRAPEKGCRACRAQARVDHVLWAEARGMAHDVHYRILELAECFGYKSLDDHGEHLIA